MFFNFFKFFKIKTIKEKDPNDYTYTKGNSTKWESEEYCIRCKAPANHEDLMSGICHTCGYFLNNRSNWGIRIFRKIK